MRNEPPIALVDLLARLGIASESQVRSVSARARRLARGLPLFESVWLDALVQARHLSLFQANEIAAGRGEALHIGSALVVERLATLGPWSEYRGRAIESGRAVRILTYHCHADAPIDLEAQLARLVERSRALTDDPRWAPIQCAGQTADGVWAVCPWYDAIPLSTRLASRGRLPLAAGIELLRQLASALVALEVAGIVHGDLSVERLLLTPGGQLRLWAPGFRAVVRPSEGFAAGSLPAECCDCLAPERIHSGEPPTVAGDIYAFGAIAWLVLTGRPAFLSANSLAKLRAICAGQKASLARLVPDLPVEIEAIILACLAGNAANRPQSYRELAARCGTPTHAGRRALVHALSAGRRASRLPVARRSRRRLPALRLIATMLVVVAIAGGMWLGNSRLGTELFMVAGDRAMLASRESTTRSSENDREPGAPPTVVSSAGRSVDPRVAPARYESKVPSPDTSRDDSRQESPDATDVLFLPTDRPLRLQALAPQAGQTVRGSGDQRPRIIVPATGLLIEAAGVRFVGIDFVMPPHSSPQRPQTPDRAMLFVTSPSVRFERCTFAVDDASGPNRDTPGGAADGNIVAIAWQSSRVPTAPVDPLPSGTLEFSQCVVLGVATLVEARRDGALRLELVDSLVVNTGPLLRFDRLRQTDEPTNLMLARTTLRDVDSLVDYEYETPRRGVGPLEINAHDCVLAPRDRGSLVQLLGRTDPEPVLARLNWQGAGTLIPVEAPLAQWIYDDGEPERIGDDELAFVGMSRGTIEFSGPPSGGTQASFLSDADLRIGSNVRPGIPSAELPWPAAPRPLARRP
ncbi:MAG: protein kinase [Pirellulales bacterium]|nr:protein kinase [Pirellulales bacterium]